MSFIRGGAAKCLSFAGDRMGGRGWLDPWVEALVVDFPLVSATVMTQWELAPKLGALDAKEKAMSVAFERTAADICESENRLPNSVTELAVSSNEGAFAFGATITRTVDVQPSQLSTESPKLDAATAEVRPWHTPFFLPCTFPSSSCKHCKTRISNK
jgi:hypothetical protein